MTTIFKNKKSPNEEQSFHSDIEVKRYPVGDVQILVNGRMHTLAANEAAELGRILCASDPMMGGLMDRAAELESTTAEQKYRILAVAPEDGWGLVSEESGSMFIFSPPYMVEDKVWVRQNDADNFIYKNGYVACNFRCTTLREVAIYLREAYIDSKFRQEIAPPVSAQLTNFLKYASDDTLMWYLQTARNKLIPTGKVVAAKRIAADLLRMRRVNDNKEMAGIAKEILGVSDPGHDSTATNGTLQTQDPGHTNTMATGRLVTQDVESINDAQGVG